MADEQSTTKPYGYIYCALNSVNGKRYIGQTTGPIEMRWASHCRDAKKGRAYPFHCAIRKYGAESFVISQLAYASSQEELNELERGLISQHGSTKRNLGYNVRHGGDSGGKLSLETRKKISKFMAGKQAYNKGKPMPEHQRLQMMERWKAKGYPGTGRICSEHTKALIAAANRKNKIGTKASEETKRRMSEAHKARMAAMTPEQRRQPQAHRIGVKRSPETIAKFRARWATPELLHRREEIMAMRAEGHTWEHIGARFGVTKGTAFSIFRQVIKNRSRQG